MIIMKKDCYLMSKFDIPNNYDIMFKAIRFKCYSVIFVFKAFYSDTTLTAVYEN